MELNVTITVTFSSMISDVAEEDILFDEGGFGEVGPIESLSVLCAEGGGIEEDGFDA